MARKIIDITDKLDLSGNPRIKIGDAELEVRADAATVLKYFDVVKKTENASDPELITKVYDLLFTDDGKEKIAELKISFKDFSVLVETAMQLITGAADGDDEKN